MEVVYCPKQKDILKGLPLELKNRKGLMSSTEDDNLSNSREQYKILM